MVGDTQGRIIVHAPLDIFDDVLPQDEGPVVGAPQGARCSRLKVTGAGRGEPGGAIKKKHVGYANRHIQRRVNRKSSPGRAQQRAQLQAGFATPYFVPAPGETAHMLPGVNELHGSMAACGLIHENMHHGHPAADDGSDPVQTPPQWRRISAVTPGPAHRGFSSTGREEDDRLRQDNQRNDDHGYRPPASQDGGYHPHRYPDGDELRHRGQRHARREPEIVGEYDDNLSRIEPDRRRNGGRRRHPSSLEEPELDHYGPEARQPRDDSGYGGGGETSGEYTYLENRGGRGSQGFMVNLDGRKRENGRDYDAMGAYGGRDRKTFSSGSNNIHSPNRGHYHLHNNHGGVAAPSNATPGYSQHHVRGADELGLAAGGPPASSSSGSSDPRSSGMHNMTYASDDGKNGAEIMRRDTSNCEELTEGEQRQFGKKTQSSIPSARWQPMPAESLQPPGAIASPRLLRREKRSPARHRRSPTKSPESPTTTGRWPCSPAHGEDKQTPESLNEALVKSPKDMLLFSKKARPVKFKPKTLKQYRETKPTGYVELGKLQPDLFTEELVAKRANAERTKEFSANLRKINSAAVAARRAGAENSRAKKPEAHDSRSKALAFARKIPLPKKKKAPPQKKPEVGPPFAKEGPRGRKPAGRKGEDGPGEEEMWEPRELTELEALQALHDDMRRKVQAARSSF